MNTPIEYSLFNAGDDWVRHYIDDSVFDESLLLNILFQDRVLMHEAYFFNSTLLSRHLQRTTGELSLFEYAALRGLIIPAVREPQADSLEAAYETLTNGTVYRDYELLTPELAPFKDRIVGAVDAGLRRKHQSVFHWPEPVSPETTLGVRYLNLLRSVLQRSEIPRENLLSDDRRQLFERVWERSKRWRFDGVEDAASRTQANGNHGLQRLELTRSIAWDIGIPATQTTIGLEDLLAHSDDPETRLAVEVFTKWLAQCHHLVQSQLFDTSINFPVYDLDEDFILDSIFANHAELADEQTDTTRVLRGSFELPPVNAMIRLVPQEIVAIRDDLGEGYRVALRRWQRNPTGDNREAAMASLRDYCSQISRNFEKRHLQPLTVTFAHSGLNALADTSVGLESVASAALGCFVSCTRSAVTLYRFFTNRGIRSRLSPKVTPLEITLSGGIRI